MWRALFGVLVMASSLAWGADDELVASPIKRYALSIGVQNYSQLDRVPNAQNDANEVGLALSRVGFVVRTLFDPDTKQDILDALEEIVRLSGGSQTPVTIVLYFAGHGFQWTGADIPPSDFVVPRMARKPVLLKSGKIDMTALLEDSLDLSTLISQLGGSRRAGVRILLLDACRSDLFAEAQNAYHQRGFLRPDSRNTVLSFSTGFNYLAASQSWDRPFNSPYATALQTVIPLPSMPLAPAAFLNINDIVEAQSPLRDQRPESLNLDRAGNFYFAPRDEEIAKERELWRKALARGDPACIESFLKAYPDGQLAMHALEKLDGIQSGRNRCVLY